MEARNSSYTFADVDWRDRIVVLPAADPQWLDSEAPKFGVGEREWVNLTNWAMQNRLAQRVSLEPQSASMHLVDDPTKIHQRVICGVCPGFPDLKRDARTWKRHRNTVHHRRQLSEKLVIPMDRLPRDSVERKCPHCKESKTTWTTREDVFRKHTDKCASQGMNEKQATETRDATSGSFNRDDSEKTDDYGAGSASSGRVLLQTQARSLGLPMPPALPPRQDLLIAQQVGLAVSNTGTPSPVVAQDVDVMGSLTAHGKKRKRSFAESTPAASADEVPGPSIARRKMNDDVPPPSRAIDLDLAFLEKNADSDSDSLFGD